MRSLRGTDLRTLRRRAAMGVDRRAALAWKRVERSQASPAFDGDPRLALITVNFSTTRYLKLMLLTLAEQEHLGLLHRIVVVDNASLDGGAELAERLAARIPRFHVVHRRRWLGHGPGLRAGLRSLRHVEAGQGRTANVVAFCDTDVVFLSPVALATVAGVFVEHQPAVVGEVRTGANVDPDIQASFVVVRRDALDRRDVPPPIHDGAPTYAMQRALVGAGLAMVDLPTYRGGLLLHRGRTGVAAATRYRPRHHYAGLSNDQPHYMGVPRGAAAWAEIEERYEPLLEEGAEDRLVETLADQFAALGTAVLED